MEIKSDAPSSNSIIPYIPDELIVQILILLPVKSLVRFNCVSKTWHSLINSPNLIKSHLKKSSENNDYSHHMMLLATRTIDESTHTSKSEFMNGSLHSALYNRKIEVTNMHNPMQMQSRLLVGTYNGLVCSIVDNAQILLWNPAMRKSTILPHHGFEKVQNNQGIKMISLSCGFGYDEANDDYKVLIICCILFNDGSHNTRAKIYNLKANSWEKIDHSNDCVIDALCYFVNGKFHWTSFQQFRTREGQKIVSLDLGSRTCEEIEQPNYGETMDFYGTLGVLEGCLTLSAYCMNEIDIWVMKEYGVKESWTKLIVVPYSGVNGSVPHKPVFQSKDGKVVFLCARLVRLAIWDPKSYSWSYHDISNLKTITGVAVCVESLVLPDGVKWYST